MSFTVSADAYGRFMGQYSEPLAVRFIEFAGVAPGQTAIDVGCGTGALTAPLAELLGTASVAAIDPSEPFVEATKLRLPELDVRAGAAESIPFGNDAFDYALAQLVVHFMADPVDGLREMARVVKPGGVVAVNVWDHAGGRGPLATFWRAAHDLDPSVEGEATLAGTREGHLAELLDLAGIGDIQSTALTVTVPFASFAAWWAPYTLGVGPAGAYVRQLDESQRENLRNRCEELLPSGAFEIEALAWAAHGHVAGMPMR
jgi:SAM-dependent methyltransferase